MVKDMCVLRGNKTLCELNFETHTSHSHMLRYGSQSLVAGWPCTTVHDLVHHD